MTALGFIVTRIHRDGRPPTIVQQVAGWTGVGFFGLALGFAAYRLFSGRPALVLTADGFFDNASAMGAGFVAWSNVEKISIINVGGQPMISVDLHDPSQIATARNPVKRLLRRANRRFAGDVLLAQILLPLPVDQIARTMHSVKRGAVS